MSVAGFLYHLSTGLLFPASVTLPLMFFYGRFVRGSYQWAVISALLPVTSLCGYASMICGAVGNFMLQRWGLAIEDTVLIVLWWFVYRTVRRRFDDDDPWKRLGQGLRARLRRRRRVGVALGSRV